MLWPMSQQLGVLNMAVGMLSACVSVKQRVSDLGVCMTFFI